MNRRIRKRILAVLLAAALAAGNSAPAALEALAAGNAEEKLVTEELTRYPVVSEGEDKELPEPPGIRYEEDLESLSEPEASGSEMPEDTEEEFPAPEEENKEEAPPAPEEESREEEASAPEETETPSEEENRKNPKTRKRFLRFRRSPKKSSRNRKNPEAGKRLRRPRRNPERNSRSRKRTGNGSRFFRRKAALPWNRRISCSMQRR